MGMFFEVGFEAANAGETLGPRAVVNAVSKASIFLGVADALIRLNIFLLVPSANCRRCIQWSLPRNRKPRRSVFLAGDTIVKDI
jgi:hypothetical protein